MVGDVLSEHSYVAKHFEISMDGHSIAIGSGAIRADVNTMVFNYSYNTRHVSNSYVENVRQMVVSGSRGSVLF